MGSGGGVDILPCFTSNFKVTSDGLVLNFDIHYSKYWTQQTVLEFAKELLLGAVKKKNGDEDVDKDKRVENPFPNGLMDEQVQKLNNELHGVKMRNINELEGPDNMPKPTKSVRNKLPTSKNIKLNRGSDEETDGCSTVSGKEYPSQAPTSTMR